MLKHGIPGFIFQCLLLALRSPLPPPFRNRSPFMTVFGATVLDTHWLSGIRRTVWSTLVLVRNVVDFVTSAFCSVSALPLFFLALPPFPVVGTPFPGAAR